MCERYINPADWSEANGATPAAVVGFSTFSLFGLALDLTRPVISRQSWRVEGQSVCVEWRVIEPALIRTATHVIAPSPLNKSESGRVAENSGGSLPPVVLLLGLHD